MSSSVWEYTEQSEGFREISEKSLSAWLGLQSYLLRGANGKLEFMRRTIKNGIEVCKFLEEAIDVFNSSNRINPPGLLSFNLFKPVKKELESEFGDIQTIQVEAKKAKELLESLLASLERGESPKLSKKSISEKQRFFKKINRPFSNMASYLLKRACI